MVNEPGPLCCSLYFIDALLLHDKSHQAAASFVLQVVRKPEEGDFIGHVRAEALMEMARIFQVTFPC